MPHISSCVKLADGELWRTLEEVKGVGYRGHVPHSERPSSSQTFAKQRIPDPPCMVPNKTKYFMLWLFNSLFDLLEAWIDKDEERCNQLFAKVIIWKRLPLLELLSEPKSMPCLSIICGYYLTNIMTNRNLKIHSTMFSAYMLR